MTTLTVKQKGYAPVNGIELYYEIYGEGQPTILLHGGIGAIEMFEPILPLLAEGRQIIGVDLQAHGRTADIDRPMRCEYMADDVAALIRHLELEQADIVGYSLGGATAQQVAIRHPEVVRKGVIISSPCTRSAFYPEVVEAMSHMGGEAAEMMKQSPPYALYSQIAPRPEDWEVLLTKLGDLLRQDYDWREAVKKLSMPVLIVQGDADSMPPSSAAEFFALLGGGQGDAGWDGSGPRSNSQLAILPGATHYDILMSPTLAATIISFLDENAVD